ncbi:MAG: aminotransferase class V-fold PLP-dependent enzyme, partial [Planctomycetes bacterium]|nr:aminotransferase class V-fold PLP-dependent enzyme [Planctomycetota bacterium]
RSMKRGEDFSKYDMTFHDDARRFEASSYNMPGIYGLAASLELFQEIGIENISKHVLGLTDRLVEGVREKGYRVISPRESGAASGIVAFTSPTHNHHAIQQHLEKEHRIIIVVREGRLRVSPHLYNSPDEIDRLIEVLPKH